MLPLRRGIIGALGVALAIAVTASSASAATVPAAPAQPTVAGGNATVVVTFSAPADGGDPITSYTATCTDGVTPISKSGASSPIAVNGLTNGTTYTCNVTAINSVGPSLPSPESFPTHTAGPPDAPAQPTLTLGDRAIAVTFAAPAGNGALILGYTAACTSIDGGAFGALRAAASPITVSGLTVGKTYTCNITATNTVGTSAPSPDSDPIVTIGVPGTPGRPSVAADNAAIVVTFKPPANNGVSITGYTAACGSSNGGATSAVSAPNSPITVTRLTNGRSYTCTASATNALGAGLPSPSSAAVVPRALPAPPTITSVVPGNAPGATGPLKITFRPDPTNGTAITSYLVTCNRLKDGRATVKSGAFSPISVGGLTAGLGYSCSMVAISKARTSRASNALVAIVGTPGLVAGITMERHPHGLTFSFIRPARNGQPILEYHAKCKSSNGGAQISQFASGDGPFTVNGMTPGKTYTCVLTAINLRGEGPPAKAGPVTLPFF